MNHLIVSQNIYLRVVHPAEFPHRLKHCVGCVFFQLKARDVAGQALSFIQDLVAALLNFHSYTEQRVHIYPLDSSIEPISPLNQKVRQPYTRHTDCD